MKPRNWIKTKLGLICHWGSGGTPLRSVSRYYEGNIPWLNISDLNDSFIYTAENHISKEGLEHSSAKMLPIDTLLLAMYGSIGKLGITKVSCTTNQAIAFCFPNKAIVDLFFLFYFLMHSKPYFFKLAKGGTQQNISQTVIKDFPICLPPMAEQKRIVKKIEELFGVIDEQVKRLETAQDALISYRQSILQKIFSTLPQEKPLRSIFKTSSGGTPSRRNAEFYSGNIPWVKSGELNYNTIIDTEEHLSQTALDNSSAKLFPKGSLLIALYGATIGRLAFLGVPAATNQAVCCIFPNEQYDMQFLYYFLQHKQKYLIFQSKGGAQKNISQEIVKELPIPTIDLPEQKSIVKKIETAFAFADKAQAAITNALEQAKQLKQSILKRAFEGKLVPQDPNDKPVDLTQLKKDKRK